ncbi:MAG: AEC family transporter [Myxococcales bacterium]|nr:AEC family transporter [Myxococcales bacterium]
MAGPADPYYAAPTMVRQLLDVVAPVLLCIAVGWVWGRSRVPFEDATISRLVLYVSGPCLIFHSLVGLDADPAALRQVAVLTFVALVVFALAGAAALRAMRLPAHTYLGPVVFDNCGNLGLPLCLFAFGREGLALGVAYFTVSFVGQSIVGDIFFASERSLKPLITSPLAWAGILAPVVLALKIPIPTVVERTTDLLGSLAIPLMLITLGISLSRMRASSLGNALRVSVLRLSLGTAVGFAIAHVANLHGTVRGVFILEAAMPVGVLNYLFALKYDRDPEGVAAAILLSTLLAFVTLPLLLSQLL